MLIGSRDFEDSSKDPTVVGIVTEEGIFPLPCNARIEKRRADSPPPVMGAGTAGIAEEGYRITLTFNTKDAMYFPIDPSGRRALIVDLDSVAPLGKEV